MNRIRSSQHGVALLEVLIAILVMAVGIIGAIGLQAKATAAMSDAGARAEAVIASERLIGLMWNDQQNLTSYAWSGTGAAPPALSNWLDRHAGVSAQRHGQYHHHPPGSREPPPIRWQSPSAGSVAAATPSATTP